MQVSHVIKCVIYISLLHAVVDIIIMIINVTEEIWIYIVTKR